jgi:hypothetical protein
MQPGGLAGPRSRGRYLRDQVNRARGQVHVVADGVLVRRAGRCEQAQHRHGQPGLPQCHRVGHVHDPEPARSAVNGRRGRRDHAVAVAIGLDHRHHLRPANVPGEGGDVVLDRAQLDERLGVTVHEVTVCQQAIL